MAKIAVESDTAGRFVRGKRPNELIWRQLASGDGWGVCDVMCNAGPHIRPCEEQHKGVSIAIVRSGTFQYRSSAGRELMTPGSLMLGNAGQYFECGHEHGVGDRCLSFRYDPRFVEELLAETGLPDGHGFSVLRLPMLRELSSVVARAHAAFAESRYSAGDDEDEWEEIAVELAVRALELANGTANRGGSLAQEARVTRVVRMIEDSPTANHSLEALAGEARLSRYHFLRVFQELTSLTPHQYVRRARLRYAATRLLLEPTQVLDIALDSGFGDVSNFNHAFQTEYGVSPRPFRKNRGLPTRDRADHHRALHQLS